jgi:hypothetical protein
VAPLLCRLLEYWSCYVSPQIRPSRRKSDRPAKSRSRRIASRVRQRPAETAGASGSLVGLITAISVGNWLAAGTAAAGMLPVIWTFWKANGGWEGIKERIRCGDNACPSRAGDLLDSADAA